MSSEETLAAVKKAIDYYAYDQKMAYDQCTRDGAEINPAHLYQYGHNVLVILREKLTPEHLANVAKWDGPEATERIFTKT